MKSRIVFIFICLFLSACGSLEDKSITEPLSIKERDELIKKNHDYYNVFTLVDKLEKYGNSLTASERKTMENISYRCLRNFLMEWENNENLTPKKEKYQKEWEDKYPLFQEKVDSIDKYWKMHLEECNASNYLKVELADIVDKSGVYQGYVRIRVRFIPLKGKIDEASVNFGLFRKGERNSLMMERNKITIDTPFTSPTEQECGMQFNYAFDISIEKVKTLSVPQLLEEYDFTTSINKLIVNGKSIHYGYGYLEVPSCVRKLWNSSFKDVNSYYVYKELVDSTIIYNTDYVNEKIENDAYLFDEECATFYYEICKKHIER